MRFSIITPSYNQGPYIQRTLKSVLEQKGDFHLQYIIMDGGSTDQTLSILEQTKAEVENGIYRGFHKSLDFRYFSEKDRGQSDAINKGLRLADGDIAAYLNSDDIYLPGSLEKVARTFQESNDSGLITGFCRIINENDHEIRRAITFYKNRSLKQLSHKRLLLENPISQPATFWNRKINDEIGFFREDLNFVMDYEMWLRITSRYSLQVIPEYLSGFRWYTTSKSGGNFQKQFAEETKVADEYIPETDHLSRFIHRLNSSKIIYSYKFLRFFTG